MQKNCPKCRKKDTKLNGKNKQGKQRFKGKKYWYTHRKLRASRCHIRNAIPFMFHYLNDENIKRSSNDLEGLNGLISDQIKRHRGLRIDIDYFIYFFVDLGKKFKIKKVLFSTLILH